MKRCRLALLLASGILAAAVAARAEEKKAGPPKPGPEVKKLDYFVGKWTSEGDVKIANPMMPAGKFTASDSCYWFKGEFHVICNSKGTGAMGATEGIGMLGYNTDEKVYTYDGIDNTGHVDHSKGATDGTTWTYHGEGKMGGRTLYGRYVMTDLTPDSYNFRWKMSEDNKTWITVLEGKTTRAAAKPAEKKEAPKK